MDGYSKDIVKEDIEKLKSIFPQCVVEGKVKIDQLLNILGEYDEKDFEKYEFTWKGKNECYKVARERTKATLLPCESESVNFNDTENLYIEGDNLEVLKILQHGYYNKIKMIYIDPPYNTGNDFVYKDDYKDSLENYKKIVSSLGKSNPETSGRFHTDWLNMMFPRLMLAHTLLKDDGVIFISIDDNEVDNLKKICNEIFGENNFVGLFPRVTKKSGKSTDDIANNNDFILVYKKMDKPKFNLQFHTDSGFKNKDEFFEERGFYKLNQTLDYDSLQYSPSLDYPIEIDGETFYAGSSYEKYLERKNGNFGRADWAWRWSKELFDFGYKNGFIVVKKYDTYSRIYTKTYEKVTIEKTNNKFEIKEIQRTKPLSTLEFTDNMYSNDNSKKDITKLFSSAIFDYSKPISLLKFILSFSTEKDDIILDFFSGSATTAHAVMQLNAEDGGNRKYIMVQLPQLCDEKTEAYKNGYKNICEIGKERIRRAGAKIKEEMENTENLDIGFRVFKLDSTNFNRWNVHLTTEEDLQQFLNNAKTLVNGRTEVEAIFEILIKNGFPLTEKIYSLDIDDYKFYYISEDCLVMISFEENIPIEIIEKAIEYAPAKIIFSRKAFKDTSEMVTAKHIISKEFSYGQIEVEFL